MNLQELQIEAYATARDKGWHDRPLCAGTWTPVGGEPSDMPSGPIEPDHDRILAKHALIHSEITEASQCFEDDDLALHYVDDKPEGFVVEIADTIIRICDLTGALGVPLGVSLGSSPENMPSIPEAALHDACTDSERRAGVARCLAQARTCVDRATETVRVDNWVLYDVQLTLTVLTLASVCEGLNLDLDEALAVKMAYNKTRPHRHGGKSA